MTNAIDLIQEQKTAATEELELARTRLELEAVNQQIDYIRGDGNHQRLEESWWEVPTDRETQRNDYGFAPRDLRFPYTRIYDRQEGRLYPFYDTEQDLQRIRATSRNIAAFVSTSWGAMATLQSYNIGTGYSYEVGVRPAHKDNEAELEALIRDVQSVVDEFLDENSFSPEAANVQGNTAPPLENELDKRTREDGEAFLWVYDGGSGEPRVRFVEPDQVTEPASRIDGKVDDRRTRQLHRDIEQWAGMPEECNWRFGIATPYNRVIRDYEHDRPIGYHVLHDEGSGDFELVPARLHGQSGVMVHARRNVTRNAKRGIPDFFTIAEKLEKLDKLAIRVVDGAAIQASIAFIRSWGKNAPDTFAGPTSTNADITNWTTPKRSGEGSLTQKKQHFRSGQIVDLYGEHAAYHAGPMGQLRSPIFIEVAQFILRLISRVWTIPEDVISGDASNNNLASIQEAHSPFRKARDKDQADAAGVHLAVIWRALEIAHRAGRFGRGIEWRRLVRMLEIRATAPDVVVRDSLSQAQENQIWLSSGVKSVATVQREIGLDPDEERESGAMPQGVPDGADPTLMAAFESIRESCDTLDEERSLLRDLVNG